MTTQEKISILGSTGSIGKSTLEVISEHPERFKVVALAAGNQYNEMIYQVKKFRPNRVSMASREAAERVRSEVGSRVQVEWGPEALVEVASEPTATYVVSALVGHAGLTPTLAAISTGKRVGLANKEVLVTAGHVVKQSLQKAGGQLFPIDSEHSAIFQCLQGESTEEVSRLILTASGGALRDLPGEKFTQVTPELALKHPNWSMGAKITIDSATMMNKGFEVIEAHWLFDLPYEQIEVLIHPQSIIHSMVEFQDGSVKAQLGTPDMKVPIQYALSYPCRLKSAFPKLDLTTTPRLDFFEVDLSKYRCFKMAVEAGRIGGTMPTVLNAANEVAVESFLSQRCSFLDIEKIIEGALASHQVITKPSLEEIHEVDLKTRLWAQDQVSRRVNPMLGGGRI